MLVIPPKAHVTSFPNPNSPQNHHSIPSPHHFQTPTPTQPQHVLHPLHPSQSPYLIPSFSYTTSHSRQALNPTELHTPENSLRSPHLILSPHLPTFPSPHLPTSPPSHLPHPTNPLSSLARARALLTPRKQQSLTITKNLPILSSLQFSICSSFLFNSSLLPLLLHPHLPHPILFKVPSPPIHPSAHASLSPKPHDTSQLPPSSTSQVLF